MSLVVATLPYKLTDALFKNDLTISEILQQNQNLTFFVSSYYDRFKKNTNLRIYNKLMFYI